MKVDDFATMSEEERKARLKIVFDGEEINEAFKELSRRKLDKYRKILNTKINWFKDKILKKTLKSQKFGSLLVPTHLIKNI